MQWSRQAKNGRVGPTYTTSVGGSTYTIQRVKVDKLCMFEEDEVRKARYLTYVYRITVTSKDGGVIKLPTALLLEQAKELAEKHTLNRAE